MAITMQSGKVIKPNESTKISLYEWNNEPEEDDGMMVNEEGNSLGNASVIAMSKLGMN